MGGAALAGILPVRTQNRRISANLYTIFIVNIELDKRAFCSKNDAILDYNDSTYMKDS